MRAHKEKTCFRVIIVIPLLPGFQGGVDDIGAATVRAIMHWQYRTICRAESSILHKLSLKLGPIVHEYISFFGLRNYGRLFEGGPLVTSQVYVHSKIMIVDDRCALIGSSNIKDRSLLGSRDSEIAIVIEDKEFIESNMDGSPWKAGIFAHNLRLSLWAEHLGLKAEEVNTKIYQDAFSCIPNDTIHSRSALRQSMSHSQQKLIVMDPMTKLKSVRGFLVCFPLEFMSQEDDLRPLFIEGEFYASPQVFH